MSIKELNQALAENKTKVKQLVEKVEDLSLPDWDDDSPIIASGYGYNESSMWEVTEKGTMRWKVNPNYTGSTAGGYYRAASWNNSIIVTNQQHIGVSAKIKQLDIREGIRVVHQGYMPNCKRVRFADKPREIGLIQFSTLLNIDSLGCEKVSLKNCYALERVEIPENITTLAAYVFQGLINLKEINLNNITEFKGSCLYESINLTIDLTFNADLRTIQSNAFGNSGIKSLTFQTPITGVYPTIENRAFANCIYLTSVTIPSGWNTNFYFSGCPFTQECLHAVIENLADLTGLTAMDFTVGATNIAKIDEEHIAMLEAKNWNYS